MFGPSRTIGGRKYATGLVDDVRRVSASRLNVPFKRWIKALRHWDERGPITYARMKAERGCHWGGKRRYTSDNVGNDADPGAIFPGRYEHARARARLHVPEDDLLADPRPEGVFILNSGRGVMGEGWEARNVEMFNSCVKSVPVRGQRTHTNARTRKGPAKTIAGKKIAKK